MLTHRSRPGMLLVEAIISVSIASIIFTALGRFGISSFQNGEIGKQYTAASFYAAEGLEAVQSIATQKFSLLTNATHGVSRGSGSYALSGTSNTWGIYTRTITISPGYRSSEQLQPNAAIGTDNGKTKKVVSEVTWTWGSKSRKVTLITFVTQWW